MDALQQLNIAAPIADIYNKLEYDIIIAIARQLSMNPDKLINHTSEWRIQMLARMGKISRETARYIAQQTRDVPGDVEAMIQETIDTVLAENGLAGNAEVAGNIAKALEMYDKQAVIDKYNQVNTVMQYKSRKAYVDGVNSVADKFEKNEITNKQEHLDVLNKNALEVTLGEKSRTEALRDTIREMSDKGIPAFVDASGREWSPEAYVNMDIRNTAKNTALVSQLESTKALGQDVILVSSHAAARPLCYPYQGKFYSLSGKAGTITDAYGKEYTYTPLSSTSYGQPAGLFGINCGHTFRGVEDGLFVNNEEYYSEKENSEEYEKIQKQRAMEREIRKNKMKRDALKAAGDEEGAKEYDRKVREGNKRMNEYCEQNGLTVRQDRTQVYGYSDPNLKQKPKDIVKTVDKSVDRGIIKSKGETEVSYYKRLSKQQTDIEKYLEQLDDELIRVENSFYDKYDGFFDDWSKDVQVQYSKATEAVQKLIDKADVKLQSVIHHKDEAEIRAVRELASDIKSFGGFKSVNLDGCNVASAEYIHDGFKLCFDRTPVLVGQIERLELGKSDTLKDYAWTTTMIGEKHRTASITLNKAYFRDMDGSGYLEALKNDVKHNKHPLGCDSPFATIAHEMGHVIEDYQYNNHLPRLYYNNKINLLKSIGIEVDDINEDIEIIDGLSEYATDRGGQEFVAEAWSEYICSPNPRPIAKAVGEYIMNQLGGM